MAALLFMGIFALFFFLPVRFRIYYRKIGHDDQLVWELRFLKGLVKRKKEISFLKPAANGIIQKERESGQWFFLKKLKKEKKITSIEKNSRGLREFFQRNRHFGIEFTLLSFALPARYQRWFLIAEHLERRGRVDRFFWTTRLGAGDAATTACLYGLLWGFKTGLLAYLTQRRRFRKKPEIMVYGDFQGISLDTVFDCIFRVKLGYIIIAALLARLRHRLLKGGVTHDGTSD